MPILTRARTINSDIDGTFVLVGVLEPGCRDDRGPCSLPKEFRREPATPGPVLVSYRIPGNAIRHSKYDARIFNDPRLTFDGLMNAYDAALAARPGCVKDKAEQRAPVIAC